MPTKPNIVIFNPDQWRGDVMGHMGNKAAVTPNLDEFVATEAVSFRNAFCQNPVCTPSRCSFMTGWYPHVRGHRTMFHMLHEDKDEPNLLGILRQQGYHIFWGGKNDLVPGQDGVENYCDTYNLSGKDDFKRWGGQHGKNLHAIDDWRGSKDGDNYYSFFAGKLEAGDGQKYLDGDWGNVLGACEFIANYSGDKPLCIYLPLSYPHPPYGVEEPFFSMIDRAAIPDRVPTPDDWDAQPRIMKGIWDRQNIHSWSEDRLNELRAVYYGQCARVDKQFGLVIEALKKREIYDDTAVFLFSDHGDFTGDYGLVEKTQNTFQDCLTRVPFVVRPPAGFDVIPGVRDCLTELVDFSETVYDILDIDPPYSRFGKSLLDVVSGKTDSHRDAVFCEGGRLRGEQHAMERESTSSLNPQGLYWPRVRLQQIDEPMYHTKAAMCRTDRWKYVRRHYESDQLFDLQADPAELNNLVDSPEHADILNQMRNRLLKWYMETCDVVPHDVDKR